MWRSGMRLRWLQLPACCTAVAVLLSGTSCRTLKKHGAKEVPANLDALAERVDGVPCLPSYVNRVRILSDGTAVLATWQDPERRLGHDRVQRRIWLRGEATRDPELGSIDTVGRPVLIDALGRGWYQPFSTKDQSCYVIVQDTEVRCLELDGLARKAAIETEPGLVWIETYAGFTVVDAMGRSRNFRFCKRGLQAASERDHAIYGTYGMVRHRDGSLLLFPRRVGYLTQPDEGRGWYQLDWKGDVWGWYLPSGNPRQARRVDLPRCSVDDVAPLPDGSFRFDFCNQERQHHVRRWYPVGFWMLGGGDDVVATRVTTVPVYGSRDCYLLLQSGDPAGSRLTFIRFDTDGQIKVLHDALPVQHENVSRGIPEPVDWSLLLDRLQAADETDPVALALAGRLPTGMRRDLAKRAIGMPPTPELAHGIKAWLDGLLVDAEIGEDTCWDRVRWLPSQRKVMAECRDAHGNGSASWLPRLNRTLLLEGLSFVLDDFTPSLALDDGLPVVALPTGGVLFAHCHNGASGTRSRGIRERACSILVRDGHCHLFPLVPEGSRRLAYHCPHPSLVFDLDKEGRLYYLHWHSGRIVVLADTTHAPFPVWDPTLLMSEKQAEP